MSKLLDPLCPPEKLIQFQPNLAYTLLKLKREKCEQLNIMKEIANSMSIAVTCTCSLCHDEG